MKRGKEAPASDPGDWEWLEGLPEEARGAAPGRGRLRGRRVLVVGAGARPASGGFPLPGNGRAIAVLCAREGAHVACADVDAASAGLTVEAIAAEGGHGSVLEADVSRPEECRRLLSAATREMGGLDGLVLNVGVHLGLKLGATSLEDWDRSYAVNVRAHALLCTHALPEMPEGSAIVFTGSIAGLGVPTHPTLSPAYDTTKAALAGLCRHVAVEGARKGVRANLVAPGLVDTPMLRGSLGKGPAVGQVPMRRPGTAWEVAHSAVFLLSGESSYLTGQTLSVDGGLTMR